MADAMAAIEASMLLDVEKMSVISQNLSNAGTAGYKKQMAVNQPFIDYMRSQQTSTPTSLALTNVTLPTMRVETDMAMGAVKHTGAPLDVVAEGNAYFVVMTPQGVAYTKQGSFMLDGHGQLVTAAGYKVLGEAGDIRLGNSAPVIDRQGGIWDDDNNVAQLKTVVIPADVEMNSVGNGLYTFKGEEQFDQTEEVTVRQGFQEMSNVVLMQEMVKMIDTMRHFEASQKMMMGYDSMMDNAINVIGDL